MVVNIIALNSYFLMHFFCKLNTKYIFIQIHATHFLNNVSFSFIQHKWMNEWIWWWQSTKRGSSYNLYIVLFSLFLVLFNQKMNMHVYVEYGMNNARFRLNNFNRIRFCLNAQLHAHRRLQILYTFQFFRTFFLVYFTAQMLYGVCVCACVYRT